MYACAGYALSAVTWVLLAAAFISELNCYVPRRTWLLRFPILFIFAGEIAKLRCPPARLRRAAALHLRRLPMQLPGSMITAPEVVLVSILTRGVSSPPSALHGIKHHM
jgi:hypothetical protein